LARICASRPDLEKLDEFVPTSGSKNSDEKSISRNSNQLLSSSCHVAPKTGNKAPILSDYLVKLVISASYAIKNQAVICRFVPLVLGTVDKPLVIRDETDQGSSMGPE